MDVQIVDMTFNLKTIAHFIPHNLLRSHFLRCNAMRGALRDIPKNRCGEDYMYPPRPRKGGLHGPEKFPTRDVNSSVFYVVFLTGFILFLNLRARVTTNQIRMHRYQMRYQPRSQGLSSYRPLERASRDPDTRWPRVSQNLGDDN